MRKAACVAGETPNASLDAGCRYAVASIMAAVSMEKGRQVVYNARRQTLS
jgi:hypothetical protein